MKLKSVLVLALLASSALTPPAFATSQAPLPVSQGGTGLNTLGAANSCFTTNSGATGTAWSSCGSSFTGPGTNGIVRTMQNKVAEFSVSVADYTGADPTGSTSSSAAFNSAVTECLTLGGSTLPGCKILIPAGQWKLSTTVNVVGSNVTFECVSHASQIVNGQTNGPAITFGDGTTTYYSNGLRNCSFAQASGVTATTGNVGLNMLKQSGFDLSNIQMGSYPGALNAGIVANGAYSSFWSDLGIQNSLYNGVTIIDGVDLHISNSRSDANANNGFLIENSVGVYVSSTTAWNNTGSAWQLYYPGSGRHNVNFFFWDAVGDTSGSNNWNITDLSQSSFTNIWGSTQQSSAVNTSSAGILLASSNVHDISFIGGTTVFNNGDGVYVYNSGGMPTNLTFTGFDFGETSNPNGRAGTGYGLHVDSAATTITVVGGQNLGNTTGQFSIGSAAISGTMICALNGYANSSGCGGSGSGGGPFPQTVSGTTTSGGIPYFSSTTELSSSSLLPKYQLLLGGGAGAAPYGLGSLGTSGQVLTSGGSGANPSWTTPSSLIIGATIGGSPTINGLLYADGSSKLQNGLLTTILDANFGSAQGDTLYRGSTGWAALTPGSSGQFLQTQGASANPQWASPTIVAATDTQACSGGNYTLVQGDSWKTVNISGSGACAVAVVSSPSACFRADVVQTGAGTVTITGANSRVGSTIQLSTQYSGATVYNCLASTSDYTSWLVVGDIVP